MSLRLLALAGALIAAAAPLPAQAGWVAEYPPVQDPDAARRRAYAMSERHLETLVGDLNAWIRMPRRVALRMVECPSSDIRWNAEEHALELCYRMAVRLDALGERQEGLREAVPAAYFYLFMHGVAHAFVDELDLPVGADPETTAHQVSALMLYSQSGTESALWALRGIRDLQQGDPGWSDWAYATAHGLGPEQVRRVACLLYGLDPERFDVLRQEGFVDAGARQRCSRDALRVSEVPGGALARWLRSAR